MSPEQKGFLPGEIFVLCVNSCFFVDLVVKSAIVLVFCEYKHWIAATEVVSRSIGLDFNAKSEIGSVQNHHC